MKVKAEGNKVILHDFGGDVDVHLTFKSSAVLAFFYQHCIDGDIDGELWITADYDDLSGGNVGDPD